METTLEKLLKRVAKDKGLKNPDRWVKERLKHSTATYGPGIGKFLFESDGQIFGVQDASFPAPRFFAFTELEATEHKGHSYTLEGFGNLLSQAFKDSLGVFFDEQYDKAIDYRLYFQGQPVSLRVYGEKEGEIVELKKGDYFPKEELLGFTTDFFTLFLVNPKVTKGEPLRGKNLFRVNDIFLTLYFNTLGELEYCLRHDFREHFTKKEGELISGVPYYSAPDIRVLLMDKVVKPMYVPVPDFDLSEEQREKTGRLPRIYWKEKFFEEVEKYGR